MVDRHRRLAHTDKIGRESAQIDPPGDREKRADTGGNGIVEIGNAHHYGNQEARVGHRARGGSLHLLIPPAEFLKVALFVAEDLHDLLPAHHFLEKPVQAAHIFLLVRKIGMAFFPAVPQEQEHQEKAGKNDHGKRRVQDDQHHEIAHDDDGALDHHGKAVVQRFGDRIDIVREAAHQLAVRLGIEKADRKLLNLVEKIPADFRNDFLCDLHHQLGIEISCGGARQINSPHEPQHPDQTGNIAGKNVLVHRRFQQVGSVDVGQRADGDQRRNNQQGKTVHPEIPPQEAERFPDILRLFVPHCPWHYATAPFFWNSYMLR